ACSLPRGASHCVANVSLPLSGSFSSTFLTASWAQPSEIVRPPDSTPSKSTETAPFLFRPRPPLFLLLALLLAILHSPVGFTGFDLFTSLKVYELLVSRINYVLG